MHLILLLLSLASQVDDWGLGTSRTYVRSMIEEPGGGFICATSGGLLDFGDYFFSSAAGYPELPHFDIRDLAYDESGHLWAATARGVAREEDYEDWTAFSTFDGLPGDLVYDIEEAGSEIWAGCDGGLAIFTGQEFLTLYGSTTGGGFTASEVTGIEEFADSLWLVTDQGVYSLDLALSPFAAASWHLWEAETAGLDMTGLCAGSDSLFGYGQDGVLRRDPGRWTVLLDYSASSDSAVSGLAETPDGLVATCRGIRRRIEGTTWETLGTGFPGATYATAVICDRYGEVWCAAGNQEAALTDFGRGLHHLDGDAWELVEIPGMPGSSSYQLIMHDGVFFSGSHNRGLMAEYPPSSVWDDFDQADGMPNSLRAYTVQPAYGGGVWSGAFHYGLTWIGGAETLDTADDTLVTFVSESISTLPPAAVQVVAPLLNNQVACLTGGGDCLWIGQEPFWETPDEPSGVVAAVGSPGEGTLQWTSFTDASGLAGRTIRNLALDASGRLWIAFAGDGGCQILDFGGTPLDPSDDAWLPGGGYGYTTGSGLPSNQVFCFAPGPSGSMAVGTGGGLCIWTQAGGFSTVQGVPGTVKAAVWDEEGRLWCMCTSCIACVDGAAISLFDDDNSPFIPSSRVETEYACLDGDDVLFSSTNGIWCLHVGSGTEGGEGVSFYPQPFLPGTDEGVLHIAGVPEGPLEVDIFELDGRPVTSIDVDSADFWQWDGMTRSGEYVSSGIYMALVRSGEFRARGRIAVVR